MPQMPTTLRTNNFYAMHSQTCVIYQFNIPALSHIIKTRPSSPRLKFSIRRKQLCPASSATKHTFSLLFQKLASKWRFSPLLPQYFILLGRQLALPFIPLIRNTFSHEEKKHWTFINSASRKIKIPSSSSDNQSI